MTTFIASYSSYAHADEELHLESEAAILIDAKTGQILYNKNASKHMYPASITKMITGLVAIEQGDLTESVLISKEATEVIGTSVYLLEGEEVELKRLVQGLLINSGNDAGLAIAEHLAGSEWNFSMEMNDFVKTKIGVQNSNFTNPHGLFDWNHYTTAYDMAKIAQYAMQNDIFREIVGTKELEWNGEGWETTLYNHHRLLGYFEGVTGIKNGYVSRSGFTLVTSAERDDVELIAVTLSAPSSQMGYNDTIALLDEGFENYSRDYEGYRDLFSDPFVSFIENDFKPRIYEGFPFIGWSYQIESFRKIKNLVDEVLPVRQSERQNNRIQQFPTRM